MKLSILELSNEKIPKNPGVYIFYSISGKILYVGKATNLRSRVGSYFSRSDGRVNVNCMMPQVAKIETRETDSVLEALILESNLIKKHQPKYNMRDKDDKSFSYFAVTQEDFPRIIILRETDLEKSREKIKTVFGPYASKSQMEKALKIIKKVFPFHSHKQKTEKGCLDFQMGRCPGPYAGNISKKDYQKNIRGIKMILKGKKKTLLKKMEKDMLQHSKEQEFEKAAGLRNKFFSLKHIQDVALISRGDDNFQFPISNFQTTSKIQNSKFKDFRTEAYDISNISGQYAVGSMVVFKGSDPEKSEYRKFKIKTVSGADDVGMMKEVLTRRFKNEWLMPDLIFLDGGRGHLNMAGRLIKKMGISIPVIAVAKGPTRKNQELRILNPKSKKEIKDILKDKDFIKQIMNEAHRFAISYHRKLRGKIPE